MDNGVGIFLCDNDTIGVSIGDYVCLVSPTVAAEIAASLLMITGLASPTLDVEGIMQAYRDSHDTKHEVH